MDSWLLLILVVQLAGTLLPSAAQDLDGCWETKGCFKQPPDCTGDDCTAFVTWEPMAGNLFKFTMKGKATGWVAFGLRESTASGMSPADVYACTSGSTEILRSENVLSYNSEARTKPANSVTKISLDVTDGTIACQFTRTASVSGDPTFFDIENNKFFMLLAVGTRVNGDGTIVGNKHSDRWASPTTFQLSDVSVPNLDGCGVTKGCFKRPDSCTGDDCTAFVTWRSIAGGKFRFSMRASAVTNLAWVAMGFGGTSGTERMSPAEVYACTNNQTIKRSFNVGYNSSPRDITAGTVDEESVVFADNVISCQFTRSESTAGDSEFYDISGDNQYYILLAVGDQINMDGTIQNKKHKERWHTSSPLKLSDLTPSASTAKPPVTTPPVTTPGELTGCGTTKGCFLQPAECTGSDCTAYVTWQTLQSGDYQFTLMGKANGYVAFGLRPGSTPDGSSGMVPADVYACTTNNELKRSENENNAGLNSNPRNIPADSITIQSATSTNGVIMCQFDRKPFLDGNSKFFNISQGNDYFILLAIGASVQPDGTIQSNRHTNRWTTSKAMSLTTEVPQADNSGIRLRKAHASLMVIGWIGFASIGIILARFFKPMWPDSKLFGTKIWFTFHRMCMISCVLCFCTAFVLIFVAVGGFVQTVNTTVVVHAILGIVVTLLGITNPIMAIFRPHPGTPNRPIFNRAHWAVGTSAHSIAIVTIFLGIGYQSSLLSGLNQYVFWVMVVFLGFHVLVFILFEVQRCMTESQGRQNDIPLQGTGANSTDHLADPDGPPAEREFQDGASSQVTKEGSTAKTILLVIYILGVVTMVFFLLVNFIIA
ncbi:putative ferric-chelate reductase 1 isoform X2 [Asterias rubens]|uniref:putative ferric-chelate reductase 1 isoform X2 n=1 Tax=Asterias rubens TaxID=7604 RepID=UPI0014556FFA|nr:putative ferric-chelate reductase 1 isoform X2 [Asterias rubens]